MRRSSLPLTFVAFVICIAFSVVAGLLILHGSDDQGNHITVLGKRVALTRQESRGHEVFAEHCSQCHQLAASHAIGTIGPDLDYVQPTYSQVLNIVENGQVGEYGDMPAGLATGPDLYAVAHYVSRVANRQAYTTR